MRAFIILVAAGHRCRLCHDAAPPRLREALVLAASGASLLQANHQERPCADGGDGRLIKRREGPLGHTGNGKPRKQRRPSLRGMTARSAG